MLFITLLLLLFIATVPTVFLAYRLKNIKQKPKPEADIMGVKKNILSNKYFIYPKGYDISLQSSLGYDDEYIQLVNTDKEDVYELRIANDFIGYLKLSSYITTENMGYDSFSKLRVKVSRGDNNVYYIKSIDDDRYLTFAKDNNRFYLRDLTELENTPEDYNSKDLIFRISKRDLPSV
jgi:hypothetical protein